MYICVCIYLFTRILSEYVLYKYIEGEQKRGRPSVMRCTIQARASSETKHVMSRSHGFEKIECWKDERTQ